MKPLRQTPEQAAATAELNAAIRAGAKKGVVSVPFSRGQEPHRHKASGRFIADADINDFLRRSLLAKSRPSPSPDEDI